MNFIRDIQQLVQLVEMPATYSPSAHSGGSSGAMSRDTSPTRSGGHHRAPKPQNSLLLQLPNDIFRCVMDYLDRDAAWALKRLCRGMANSEVVDELLYRYPIQLNDVRDLRLADWKNRTMGMARWHSFKESINDKNRRYVQKLAMSHWCSIADFQWIEANLPSLTSLDISAIKDFVWTPEETWTWGELASACWKLFARLEEIEVSNWADYTAHSRIEYSYSYGDYRYKLPFRMSRRRDCGSVASMILPVCKKLKTLAIREKYSGFHTWNEWEVHQRVCCLVDGIMIHCPPSLTKLRVHDYAPYRSLFSTDATSWLNIKDIEIGLYAWMEDRRERDVIGPVPYRITQGAHHRDEEDAFDDKSFESCTRDHMALGSHVVQDVGASFEDLLQSLRTIVRKYPNINIQPIDNLRDITLHPFHLVNVNQRRAITQQANSQPQPDPVSNQEIQEALRWLATNCGWKPILAWDSMMCDVFPANLEPNRSFLPKADVLSRIQTMVSTLRSLNIPIRISIGDRANTCPTSGLDGSLYFGDYKTFVGEGEERRELLAPTQACFNLTAIAPLVDELTIQYPVDVPGVHGWLRTSKRPTPAEEVLFRREMIGWRRFWERYASQFKNLKKLTANIPNDIYNDWGKCEGLRDLLSDKRWKMLEIEDQNSHYGFFGSYFPFSSLRYNFARKRPRIKFVQRVFFRQDDAPLNLRVPSPALSVQEREENEIRDSVILGKEFGAHVFWPDRKAKVHDAKRKADVGDGEGGKETKVGAVDEGAERPVKKRKVD
ncbi:hypothetical protein P280DRAFT_465150 [Massarina eburnea CBS 473.64]|uniref:F-box domain-containing protein n=1 Tax=Massarina eburnea CBS 473.64 TaxID=1395130 RepID=A0A6A6SDE7_9PLEO|nr:hypothetical protein P280DRAFT_465150 [Massarina eburnea CBS 473.64]